MIKVYIRLSKDNISQQMDTRIEILKHQVKKLSEKVEELKEEKMLREAMIISADLARLYNVYTLEPLILKHFRLTMWRDFSSQLREKELLIDENQMASEDLDQWLAPLEKDTGIDMRVYRRMIHERNNSFHHEINSVKEQQSFLSKVETFQFPNSFSHTPIIQNMLSSVKRNKLKRI